MNNICKKVKKKPCDCQIIVLSLYQERKKQTNKVKQLKYQSNEKFQN